MLFQLPIFLLFFMSVLLTIRLVRDLWWQKIILLLCSLFFYSFWNVHYIYVLGFYVFLGVFACRLLANHPKFIMVLVLVGLIPLVFFKYTNFLLVSLGFDVTFDIGLPLGISFITFTLISMMIDFSRMPKKSKFTVLDISLYISFFPHLIAGPILRSRELIPQLSKISVSWQNIVYNLPLFSVGMMKKVLIADQIGTYVHPVFLHPEGYGSHSLLLAACGFAVQIYCDFSAYSDMAIATAGMLGIRFPENFHSPYLAHSLTETWKRWHMTLSFWLRDYIFIPLVRRFRDSLPYMPILITMLASGLWHGANWTFVLWGGLQGVIMMLEKYTGYDRFVDTHKYIKPVGVLLNFIVWLLLLILFRSSSIEMAISYYQSLFSFHIEPMTSKELTIWGLIFITLALHAFDHADLIRNRMMKIPFTLSVPVMMVVIIGCSMVAAQRPESFYYFDF
ncbi:MBOAT family O-acyltransferase [Vibrio mangrovi]|uniref:Probable alginate O-acetylase n=1 Tax=Vibrio mangrovi TaxID=474394 RepID=A0A1Y6IV75_9VIBR|nr:MBOAT family O-acyltransferase [Vibrio mangrovi]MDW6003269.1 MBOAT family O-acyltransferase [Vibrio mangrovi]SMR99943.1 Peptidoglycan O-acetyltransferase [Vibrio mangrovi]